jgi:hypothetical protein
MHHQNYETNPRSWSLVAWASARSDGFSRRPRFFHHSIPLNSHHFPLSPTSASKIPKYPQIEKSPCAPAAENGFVHWAFMLATALIRVCVRWISVSK